METVTRIHTLRERVSAWRQLGLTVGFVPTMGNLHHGHFKLVTEARRHADRVVVSVFINPLQFGPTEDYADYPRTPKQDAELLDKAAADLLFQPEVAEIFPAGPDRGTVVDVPQLSGVLCGAVRPGHFAGVATVVTKLLNIVQPQVAVFGEKDYQQLLVIKQLVRDLNIPVQIVSAPIVREEDGLALSSRNGYLSAAERKTAPILHQVLSEAAASLADGEGCDAATSAGRFKLEGKGFRVDYVAVRDPETLAPLFGPIRGSARVMGAAYLGTTRLIDNVPTEPKNR